MHEEYWNQRILRWEKSRYGILAPLNPFSFAVWNRQRLALAEITRWHTDISRASILDLGCGSGLLGARLRPRFPAAYRGVDFSERSIQAARQRKMDPRLSAAFFCEDLSRSFQALNGDFSLAVALGLIDWLPDPAIEAILSRLSSPHLILSYSEMRSSGMHSAFSLYHRWQKSERSYPRLFASEGIHRLLGQHGYKVERCYEGPRLGVGKLLVAARK